MSKLKKIRKIKSVYLQDGLYWVKHEDDIEGVTLMYKINEIIDLLNGDDKKEEPEYIHYKNEWEKHFREIINEIVEELDTKKDKQIDTPSI